MKTAALDMKADRGRGGPRGDLAGLQRRDHLNGSAAERPELNVPCTESQFAQSDQGAVATGLPGRSVPTIFPLNCSALLISGLGYRSQIIVLSIPAMKTTSKPRSDAVITGAAET